MGGDTICIKKVFRRSTFKELEKLTTQRFDYELLKNATPDFSQMEIGTRQFVTLANKTTKTTEILAFLVTHNRLFPTGQRAIYGLIETTDGRAVQIEFNIYEHHKEFNRIVAFLRTQPLHRLSPIL